MFTPDIHLLSDPWAPHPVANRHICSGGGGEHAGPPVPDYSQYISKMTQFGEQGMEWAKGMFDWAKGKGVDLSNIATRIGGAAETAATGQQGRADTMMDKWREDYDPLYKAQREDAQRMMGNLPQYEEEQAGAYGADVGTAIDQGLAAEQRKQDALGISPGVGSMALDTQARIGRAAATTAAAETGRRAARDEARGVTAGAIQTGQFIPGVAGQQAGLATANRGQAAQIPMQAASTSAGLYAPSQGYYGAAQPYMKAWGDTTGRAYDQALASAKMTAENDTGGIMGAIAPIAGGIAGSFMGPMGASIGSSLGGLAGKAITAKAATGGKIPKNGGRRIPRFANGGAIDTAPPMDDGNMVTPDMSPSGGDQVDDVHAMVSEGEFVIPERTVDWYGEKFFQNLISKADNEAQDETVAAPEQSPEQQGQPALDTMPPMFRSEGARV